MAAVADVPHGLTRGEILDKLGLKVHKTTETSVSNALTVLTSSCEGRVHGFDRICRANAIEHRLAKAYHPWTNGQVERMNRTIKEATVKRFYYETHNQLRSHLADFVSAYNFAKRLKTLKGLTPYEFICKAWTKEPARFTLNPIHQMPGLNT